MAYAVLTPMVLLPPVWPAPLSLAATGGISFDFSSSGYLDVSLPRVPRIRLCVQRMLRDSSSRVFPHSDISGSKLICSSPKLFAACHVLRRLPMPRHSPCALISLTFRNGSRRSSGSLRIMQVSTEVLLSQNCIYPNFLKFHICFQLRPFQIAPSVALLFIFFSVQFSRCNSGRRRWWRIAGSNR